MSVRNAELSNVLSMVFDNRFMKYLPIDSASKSSDPFVSRVVRGACFTSARTTPLVRPQLVCWSPSALRLLGVEAPTSELPAWKDALTSMFSGNESPIGSDSYAHCYAGYQFGSYSGQLGDGAVISLGEVLHNRERWEVQLKGAGPTAFSRKGDGRKVLRSSVREFLCSEAMHYLGVPTTRAAVLITSDTTVERDPLYTGRVVSERCSVCTRVAPAFFRFGSFEIHHESKESGEREGPSSGMPQIVRNLIDFTGSNFFPELSEQLLPNEGQDIKDTLAIAVLHDISRRTGKLVADWQSLSFCHGVLNTDNMSILGLTMDYGPFAFLPYYDPTFVSNLSDRNGRYAFGRQAEMAKWNIEKLCEAFGECVEMGEDEVGSVLNEFDTAYKAHLERRTLRMLGLTQSNHTSSRIVEDYFKVLTRTSAMPTKVLRLMEVHFPFNAIYFRMTTHTAQQQYLDQCASDLAQLLSMCCITPSEAHSSGVKMLRQTAPQIPRRQILPLKQLLSTDPSAASRALGAPPLAVKTFLDEQEEQWVRYEALVTLMSQTKEMPLSDKRLHDGNCWLTFINSYFAQLREECTNETMASAARAGMRASNPRFLLFPWILDDAVKRADRLDFNLINQLADRITRPYEDDPRDGVLWSLEPPSNVSEYLCSCSS